MGYGKLPDIKIDKKLALFFGHENENLNSTVLIKMLWKHINENNLKVENSAKGNKSIKA